MGPINKDTSNEFLVFPYFIARMLVYEKIDDYYCHYAERPYLVLGVM